MRRVKGMGIRQIDEAEAPAYGRGGRLVVAGIVTISIVFTLGSPIRSLTAPL